MVERVITCMLSVLVPIEICSDLYPHRQMVASCMVELDQ